VRYYEILEALEADKAVKQQQARKRANDSIRAADRQRSDELRRYQEQRKKAADTGDTQKAADAMNAYNSAREKADTKSSNARARLSKPSS
jgi:hypothetical protein